MSKLRHFMTENGIKQADFAASIGATQGLVSRLIGGTALPSLKLAARIERVTGGAVPASSWIPTEEAPAPEEGEAA